MVGCRSAGLIGGLLILSACYPTPGPDKSFTGAVLGAGWGAGAGAVIGNQTHNAGPGAAIGAAFGAASGLLTGLGLDIAEGTELQQQRELDAIKVEVAANTRNIMLLQDVLDDRGRLLHSTSVTEQVFFDPDRASLRAGGAVQLERFAEAIKLNPYVGAVEIHGHADDSGSGEENQRLSEARARTVATFLSMHGIPFDQLRVYGHGAERPLASEVTEVGKQLNRRVEIVLLK